MKFLHKYGFPLFLIIVAIIIFYIGSKIRYSASDIIPPPGNANRSTYNPDDYYIVQLDENESIHLKKNFELLEFINDRFSYNEMYMYGSIHESEKESIKESIIDYINNHINKYNFDFVDKIEFNEYNGIFNVYFNNSNKDNIESFTYAVIDDFVSLSSMYRKMLNIKYQTVYIKLFDENNECIKDITKLR